MEESQSLRSLFQSAKDAKAELESRGDTNSQSYQDAVNTVIAKFDECQRQVSVLSLFSANESLDDLSTGDLQFVTGALSQSPSHGLISFVSGTSR